jgi:hypothetical protein
MPSPGDPAHLKANLKEIAALPGRGTGAKLDYDPKTMRFSVREGELLQGLWRAISGDSVTNESTFGGPIREVFAAAHARAGQDAEIQSLQIQALNGLEFLRKTYAGNAEKLQVLNRVIVDANLGMKEDPEALQNLRNSYRKYLVYAFTQSMFIEEDCQGVCDAFTLDWARRILISGKRSFAVSKHSTQPAANRVTLDWSEKKRMMDKVDKRIRPMQDALVKGKQEGLQYGPKNLAEDERYGDKYRSFARLDSVDWGNGSIRDKAPGSEVMSAILAKARKGVELWGNGCFVFVISLKVKKSGAPGGHAIAFRLGPEDEVHFFDPNIGEFGFLLGSSDPQRNFWNEWWTLLYYSPQRVRVGDYYTQWRLKVLSRDAQ